MIWNDCIRRGRSNPANRQNWKITSLILMSISMSMNLLLLFFALEKLALKRSFYKIYVPGMPIYVNNVIIMVVLYFLPCCIINFLLIFWKDKYKQLSKRYPYYKGKLFLTYLSVSMLLPVVLLWGAIIVKKLNLFGIK